MGKLVIIYHSGSGSTKTVGKLFRERLTLSHDIDMVRVHEPFDYSTLSGYDFLIIGFPTYFWEPSSSITRFVSNMPVYERAIKAFVFTTCGLYNGNSLRMMVKQLRKKNIVSLAHTEIKGPASDYFLFPMSMASMFQYEKGLREKIDRSVKTINTLIEQEQLSYKVPPYKWYVPINNLNKYPGKKIFYHFRDKMHVREDSCTNCGLCVSKCERNCWSEGDLFPRYDKGDCEFCLGCVHNCPSSAIAFSGNIEIKQHFNKTFYSQFFDR